MLLKFKDSIMAVSKCGISRCGLCRFYCHEGQRGGRCSQLNAPVNSSWKACRLAISPFLALSESAAGIARCAASKGVSDAIAYPVESTATSTY